MAIDDILEEATHPRHERESAELADFLGNLHWPLLEEFYKKGLSEAERAKFEALPQEQKVAALQASQYKLKDEQAEQLVGYLAVQVLSKKDEQMGGMLKAALDTLYNNPQATPAQRTAARQRVNTLKTLLTGLGFNVDEFERTGKLRGFSRHTWNGALEELPQRYQAHKQQAILGEIPVGEAHKYLSGIASQTGLKEELVKAAGPDAVRAIAAAYHRTVKRQGDVEGFKRAFPQYH